MQRIAVVGCGGSGKTALARQLGRRLDLPVVHVDGHYWRTEGGRRVESSPQEWERTHRELIAGERWVIDGMKLGVLAERLAAADTAIYLDLPMRACLWGVLRRRLRYRGRLRPDIGVYDRINWSFLRWIWSFRRVQRPVVLERLAAAECDVVVLRRRRDVREFLGSVRLRTRGAPMRHGAV
jgi:adenylate kinase family enzyme